MTPSKSAGGRVARRSGSRSPSEASPKRVLLFDEHRAVREAIKRRVSGLKGVEIVAEARDEGDAIEKAAELSPDLVFVGTELPMDGAADTTSAILKACPEARVIILTAREEPEMGSAARRAGASGYIRRSADGEELGRAVRAVASGGSFIEDPRAPREAKAEKLSDLSPREFEILELLGEGLRVKGIAERLSLSASTVHTHVRHAILKLGVQTRTEGVAVFAHARAKGGSGPS